MALVVPLSRFTSRVGGGSAFFVRRHKHKTSDSMATIKNVHSPSGMHFSSDGTKHTNLIDCPTCKFGTLDNIDDATMRCADCKRYFTVEMLVKLHVLPKSALETSQD